MKNELIPKRRFKEFIDDGPWEEKKFKQIFEVSQGLQIAISKRFLKPGKNRFFYITNEFLKNDYERKYYIYSPPENVICNRDDILMTRTGNTGIVVTNVLGCFHNNFFKIKYDKQCFDKYFIYYFLSSPKMKKIILSNAGNSTIPDLSHDSFYKLYGQFPNIKEQQKIGDFFQKLDKLISLQKKKLEKTKNIKKAYLSDMFPKDGEKYPKRRFKGFTEPWEEKKLGEVGITFNGLSGKTKKDFGHGKAKFVTYMNVFSNPISKIEQTESVEIDEKQNEVRYGDVFFTTSSETPEEVGMSSVWLGDKHNIYLNSFCFGYRPIEIINPFYMAYMLRSPKIRKEFQLLAQGISRYNISKIKAMNIKISLPKNISEQQKIGDFFQKLDNMISQQQKKLEKLEKIKAAYLEEMFI